VTYDPDPAPVGFQGKTQLDAADTAEVMAFNASIGVGTELDQETMNGLATAADFNVGRWDLSGSIEARFKDRTFYDKGAGTAQSTLQLQYDMGASGSLTALFRNVRIERSGVPVTGRDVLSSTFNWRCDRPSGGNAPLTITLVNDTANYSNPS